MIPERDAKIRPPKQAVIGEKHTLTSVRLWPIAACRHCPLLDATCRKAPDEAQAIHEQSRRSPAITLLAQGCKLRDATLTEAYDNEH